LAFILRIYHDAWSSECQKPTRTLRHYITNRESIYHNICSAILTNWHTQQPPEAWLAWKLQEQGSLVQVLGWPKEQLKMFQ